MTKREYVSDYDNIMEIRRQLGNNRLSPNHDESMEHPLVLYLNKACANPVNLEAYDNIDNCEYMGHRSKSFMLADGDIFKPLYLELRNNPYSSYITYMNDVIKSGYDPEHLSALVYRCIPNPADELFNSRLLNLFEVPTVYMQNLLHNANYNYLLSVDFVAKDEEFYSLLDLIYYASDFNTQHIVYYDFFTAMEDMEEPIHAALTELYAMKDLDKSDEFISSVHKDVMSSLLYQRTITKYILGLTDNESKNNGILFNTKTHIVHMAPEYDLEQMLITWTLIEDDQMLVEDLRFLKSNYPEVIKKLENTFSKVNSPTGKQQILDIKEVCKPTDRIYNIITHNIDVFSDMLKESEHEKED